MVAGEMRNADAMRAASSPRIALQHEGSADGAIDGGVRAGKHQAEAAIGNLCGSRHAASMASRLSSIVSSAGDFALLSCVPRREICGALRS